MNAELIEFAQIRLAMTRALETGQTMLSKSGNSIIFAVQVCGRNDLSGRIEQARAQMDAAGIDYRAIPPYEAFSVSKEDWKRLEADPKLLAYRIVKKGRKWLEGIHIFGETAIQIELNDASRAWEVGSTYVFAGETKKEFSKYGTKVQVFPDCESARQRRIEEERIAEKAKAAKEIERWLGFVEEKAPTGYWYEKGEAKLAEYGVSRHGQSETDKRLAAAHACYEQAHKAAEKQRAKDKARRLADQWLGYIRENIRDGKGWYAKGESVVKEQISVLVGHGEDIAGIREKLEALRQEAVKAQTGGFDGPTYRLGGSSGYGCRGWSQGEVVRNTPARVDQGDPEFLFVLSAEKRYVAEDGMSFGVGDESGYLYSALCRAATEEEAAPLAAKLAREKDLREAKKRVREISRKIQAEGEYPAGAHDPEGERLFDTQNIYGGGDWFVVGPEWIWFVENNGSDGGDWSRNNVRTGGAGAVGRRVPFDAALAGELRELQERIKEGF